MKLTFWEIMFRATRRRHPWSGAKALAATAAWLSNHGVTETCTIAAAEHGAPAGAGAMIASEMAAFRGRASTAGHVKAHGRTSWYVAAIVVVMCGLFLQHTVRHFIYQIQHGEPWLGELALDLAIAVGIGLFGAYQWGLSVGEARMFDRLRADWAERLQGKSGADVLDEVVAWLETRWAWFLPPNLGANDVLWALGARRGVPVLAVLERYAGTLILNMAAGAAAGVRNNRVPGGWWTRNNIFIHGVRFRDAAHKERVRKTMAMMGGGAIQGPNGVYLYAAFSFMRLYREKAPTSEIWIDLIDQVIDPDFPGSESAAREIHDELVLLGMAAPEVKPHA